VADSHKDIRDGVSSDFLFSLMAKGNDFANQNFTALLSGPYVSAGAISVTPGNFERAMVWHAVRRIPKATWLNDRDQWMQPTKPLTPEFSSDCAVWSAFSTSNQTASLADIKYKGEKYDLANNLFPFQLSDIRNWKCTLSSIETSLQAAKSDRFFARWLSNQSLSLEASDVLTNARKLYEFFYANAASVPWPQYKIKRWDVGLYQVRRSLADADLGSDLLSSFNKSVSELRAKLLPQIADFGFMQGVERLFEDEVQH
jgi:hypothetical protein